MAEEKTERPRRRRRRTSRKPSANTDRTHGSDGGSGNRSSSRSSSSRSSSGRPASGGRGSGGQGQGGQGSGQSSGGRSGRPGGQRKRSRNGSPGQGQQKSRPPRGRGKPPRGRGRSGRPQGRRGGGRKGGGRREEILKKLYDQLQLGTSIDPHERWILERKDESFTPRILDLIAPIGRGQRCLIVAPPKAGKTTLLLEIAQSLSENHPDAEVFALLVDERPEEVTHFRRSTEAEVIASSSDQVASTHVQVVEEAMQRVLELVLEGKDVVLLLDSITRLARSYNTVQGDSGRTLSGGLDANTMQMPRRLFGAARKLEEGGSLTILGTALVDTGSRMDEVIFQEFKGTGNTEVVLSRQLFEKRIFPAVDIAKSGTRKEEKLYDPRHVEQIHKMRRVLSNMDPARAMEGLLKLMAKHKTNEEMLSALP